MNLIIIGPPGSGKGTQAKLLSKKLGVPAISMGEVMRNADEANTVLGDVAAKYMYEGKLVPKEIITSLTRFRLREEDCKEGFILDGAPRRAEEAILLDDNLKKEDKNVNKVLVIQISDDEAKKRLLKRYTKVRQEGGGRKDDNLDDIKERLFEYRDNERALLSYYESQDKLLRIDGEQTIVEVHRDICNALSI